MEKGTCREFTVLHVKFRVHMFKTDIRSIPKYRNIKYKSHVYFVHWKPFQSLWKICSERSRGDLTGKNDIHPRWMSAVRWEWMLKSAGISEKHRDGDFVFQNFQSKLLMFDSKIQVTMFQKFLPHKITIFWKCSSSLHDNSKPNETFFPCKT